MDKLALPVQCRSALNKTGIPGFDYCLNPYTGCSHACLYCYATLMKKYAGHQEDWGSFVDAKMNIAEKLGREVWKKQPGSVVIGSVCDAYQPAEKELRLTRRCLEVLVLRRFPFTILTKSNLVLRDIDLIKQGTDSRVSITLTTLDEDVRMLFEPGAPSARDRVEAIWRLVLAGIDTRVFVGPILPWFTDTDQRLREILEVLQRIGARHVMFDKLNYLKSKMPSLAPLLKAHFPEAIPSFRRALEKPAGYTEELRRTINEVSRDFKLEVEVVF